MRGLFLLQRSDLSPIAPTEFNIVIPGRCEAPNPESSLSRKNLDSGFRPAAGPGMTVSNQTSMKTLPSSTVVG
jgi:hypothetical protein